MMTETTQNYTSGAWNAVGGVLMETGAWHEWDL